MEADFRALLATDATLIGLVSTSIYPSTYAQAATSPAVRYFKVTGAPGLHMQGSDGLSSDLMQVDARADTASSALAVRDALVARLNTFRGIQGATDFQLISLRDDRGVQFDNTGPQSFYTASLDFDCWSRAAA